MNVICLIGNLTKDVEIRATKSGKQVLQFDIAYNEHYGENKVHYFNVVAFGQEGVAPYLTKGKKVGIRGRLTQQRWQAQDGSNRSKVEIVAERIYLLSKTEQTEQPAQETNVYDEDIPF